MHNHSDKAQDAEDRRMWSAWCRTNRLEPTRPRSRKHQGKRDVGPAGRLQSSSSGLTSTDEADWLTAVNSGFEDSRNRPARQPPVETRQIYRKIARRQRSAGPGAPLQLERRTREKLQAGKLSPAAIIDLHGETLAEARRATIRFVVDSRRADLRLVLVITGKGQRGQVWWDAGNETGVLRRAMPGILGSPELRPHVQHFQPAHGRHGGSGAFYVWLRRQRK